ncbi:MAG: hypothetical protein CL539_06340 [Alcanivorax sp.]|nr:hypothetical protein [Alcanivorax sp.]
MSLFTTITMTIPVEHAAAANRCAAIFDFDVGGAETFKACRLSATGQEPATHIMASTVIKPEYVSVLQDAEQVMPALTHLAEVYGREDPVLEDVEAFCNNVLVGEHPDLLRIAEDEPAA